jgi:hypothetical protein
MRLIGLASLLWWLACTPPTFVHREPILPPDSSARGQAVPQHTWDTVDVEGTPWPRHTIQY